MYATAAEVKNRTTIPEVAALDDAKVEQYIERANGWLHRATRRTFREETDPDRLAALRTATVLLVEYLWFWDHPDIKETIIGGVDSERIGSYSYTAKKTPVQPGQSTGNPELDSIIGSLMAAPSLSVPFFAVRSGNSEI